MKLNRFALFMATAFAAFQFATAQSYFDDDIYYDASKDKAAKAAKKTSATTNNGNYQRVATYGNNSANVIVEYPAADTYNVNGTRTISVDDYNRRGIFATDSLTSDTTSTDFQYTRRIEQFYNPEIVSGSGDKELAEIYYMEPQTVNVYVNTPSAYWGYDYFYPSFAWNSPFYYNNRWRWNSGWYWNSWYDPYWSWGWGPSWAWGPSWSWGWGAGWGWGPAWGPSWGWGWGPSMGRPYNPRHPGVNGYRPGSSIAGNHSSGSYGRPGIVNGNRHNNTYNPNMNYRPGTATGRPGLTNGTTTNGNRHNGYTRPSNSNTNNNYSRPSNTNNNSYSRPTNTNGGRYGGSYNSGGGSRGGFGGGGYSGGSRSSGGGRGRH